MKWLLVAVVVIAVVGAIGLLLARRRTRGSGDDLVWPFYAKKLLTQPEQVLYFRLVKAVPEYIVLAQVQLSRFLGVKKGNDAQGWLNRINRMSADFVVCTRDTSVMAVIELDDASHQGDRRVAADAKKDAALSAAGVRVVRWQARELPDDATIRMALVPAISNPK